MQDQTWLILPVVICLCQIQPNMACLSNQLNTFSSVHSLIPYNLLALSTFPETCACQVAARKFFLVAFWPCFSSRLANITSLSPSTSSASPGLLASLRLPARQHHHHHRPVSVNIVSIASFERSAKPALSAFSETCACHGAARKFFPGSLPFPARHHQPVSVNIVSIAGPHWK